MVTPADLVPYIFSPGPEDPASVMMGYFVAEYVTKLTASTGRRRSPEPGS